MCAGMMAFLRKLDGVPEGFSNICLGLLFPLEDRLLLFGMFFFQFRSSFPQPGGSLLHFQEETGRAGGIGDSRNEGAELGEKGGLVRVWKGRETGTKARIGAGLEKVRDRTNGDLVLVRKKRRIGEDGEIGAGSEKKRKAGTK